MASERALDVLHWIDNPLHAQMVRIAFPLDTFEQAKLELPRDLLPQEADRLCRLIQAWVIR